MEEMKTEETRDAAKKSARTKDVTCHGSSGAVYGLGLIGAVVYYIRFADGFWDGVLGVLKAFVWPAFLVYEAMKALGM